MTREEMIEFLKRHRLSAAELADILGVTPMAINHWCYGVRNISKPMGRLCRLFDKHPELMEEFN